MKLKEGFMTHQSNDEQILIDTTAVNFSGLVRSNSTAAFIVECLKTDTTEQEILAKMLEEYDGDENAMKADITKIVGQLKSIGAIDD